MRKLFLGLLLFSKVSLLTYAHFIFCLNGNQVLQVAQLPGQPPPGVIALSPTLYRISGPWEQVPIGTPSCPQTVPPPAPGASLCPSRDRVKHHPVRPREQIPSPSLQSRGVRQDPASASPSSPQAQLRFPSLGTCGPHCAVSHMSLKASSCPLLLLHVSLSFLTCLRLSGGLCPISQDKVFLPGVEHSHVNSYCWPAFWSSLCIAGIPLSVPHKHRLSIPRAHARTCSLVDSHIPGNLRGPAFSTDPKSKHGSPPPRPPPCPSHYLSSRLLVLPPISLPDSNLPTHNSFSTQQPEWFF